MILSIEYHSIIKLIDQECEIYKFVKKCYFIPYRPSPRVPHLTVNLKFAVFLYQILSLDMILRIECHSIIKLIDQEC